MGVPESKQDNSRRQPILLKYPKTGEAAYLFNKQDRNDLIGQGGFHLVFKATRN